MSRKIVLIAHDIRSCHNVGSLLRTAEGLGIDHVYLTGYTPHPGYIGDARLPHLVRKLEKDIHKTALGAETTQPWSYQQDVELLLDSLRMDGFITAGLEQSNQSIPLPDFRTPDKTAILLGREVEGIDDTLLKHCDVLLEIPMFGQKESFNVVQAAAMALYHCRLIYNNTIQ